MAKTTLFSLLLHLGKTLKLPSRYLSKMKVTAVLGLHLLQACWSKSTSKTLFLFQNTYKTVSTMATYSLKAKNPRQLGRWIIVTPLRMCEEAIYLFTTAKYGENMNNLRQGSFFANLHRLTISLWFILGLI